MARFAAGSAVPQEMQGSHNLISLPQKGGSMIRILLFCAMILQSSTQGTPAIDNDRVTVWGVTNFSVAAQPVDAVVVSSSGAAEFVPKGATAKISGHLLVINLKDHPVPPIENKSGYPLGFPRPGSKKLLENARVIVWDYTWQPGVATPMHFHDKDVVAWFLEDGDLSSTTPDGKSTVNHYTADMVRFNAGNRMHTETLVKGKERAIITELK